MLDHSVANIEEILLLMDNKGCVCPSEYLTYECTVMGEPGGTTVWLGSAFNCISREISLFHSNYESTRGAYGECGDIEGQGLRVVNDTNNQVHVSQLRVPIRSDTAGKTIECQYDNGIIATSIGQLLLVPAATGID